MELLELLNATSINYLRRFVQITSLGAAATTFFFPPNCRDLDWSSAKLYGTKNFWLTVQNPDAAPEFVWNGVLRMVDVVVVFKDSSTLMLSEREADEVLAMLLVDDQVEAARIDFVKRRGNFGLAHVGFAFDAISQLAGSGADCDECPLASIPMSLGFSGGKIQMPRKLSVAVKTIVACRLLNGDTHFASHQHPALMERVLRPLIAPVYKREETLRGFMEARRMTQRWSLSFLQELAKRMDLEECAM